MADPESVGKAFLQYYYQLFETNRAGLATLYQDASMLTFEGQKFQGPQAIVGKLGQLPFNQCKINADTMDFQPSVSGGVMVFVTGKIIVSAQQQLDARCKHMWTTSSVGSAAYLSCCAHRLYFGTCSGLHIGTAPGPHDRRPICVCIRWVVASTLQLVQPAWGRISRYAHSAFKQQVAVMRDVDGCPHAAVLFVMSCPVLCRPRVRVLP
jgi:hypothetical protein